MASEATARDFSDDETTGSYSKNFGAHRPGIKPQEVADYYTEWAREGTYEEHLSPERYQGPTFTADAIGEVLGGRKDAEIIDVAAGTGTLGEQLKDLGFTNIDALDPSQGMLDIAETKGIYRKLICGFMDHNRLNIPDGTYDVLGIAGGMGEGHIPCSALPEMARLVKPGGHVVIMMREEYLGYVKEYVNRLEPAMHKLEELGRWKMVQRSVIPKYSFDNNGVLFVFQIV